MPIRVEIYRSTNRPLIMATREDQSSSINNKESMEWLIDIRVDGIFLITLNY
ncbi:MAG: hypothetical protein ACXACU_01610 [Candidatus Hodarchaeales archaeon]|jgi:hypothetical protein